MAAPRGASPVTGHDAWAAEDPAGSLHGERRRALRIGLTGPIGCGKSTVAGWLGARGAIVIDADAEARAVVELGEPALAHVLERFGDDVRAPDGSLDRAALGRIVFADAAALRDLETIVHPAVRPRILAAIAAAEAAGARVIVVEAIKLIEGGLAGLCDEIWLITCSPDEQRARLAGRGVAADDAGRRITAQGEFAVRVGPSTTRILDTGGDRAIAEARVADAFAVALADPREHGGSMAEPDRPASLPSG